MSAERSGGSGARWLAIAASAVVAATVVAAIMTMDSPTTQRQIKLDQRRVQDLEHLVAAVDSYVRSHDTLPPDLATLAGKLGQQLAIADPVGGAPYAYAVTGERRFRLCAVFATDTATKPPVEGNARWVHDEWDHGAGRQCFDRKVTPPPTVPD